jgi:hypothetical protein
MQKDGQCLPGANQSNDEAKSCMTSSCLFSRPKFLSFFIPFVLGNLIYQADGYAPNASVLQLAPGIVAGLICLSLYSVYGLARQRASRAGISRQMPIQADYMRKTNLTISQLDLDPSSALTPGSKEN